MMKKNWAMLMTMVIGGCGGADFVAAPAPDVIDPMKNPVKDGASDEGAITTSCRLIRFGENTGGIVCPPAALVHVLYECAPAIVLSPSCIQPERGQPYWCCKD